MAETATTHALLIVAIQDLCDAARGRAEGLAGLSNAVGTELRSLFGQEETRSENQVDRLEQLIADLDGDTDGDPNIWMRAIVDDATRDSESTAAGPLRDIAMAEAFRKGAQSARVSFETAMFLAGALDLGDHMIALTKHRDDEAEADDKLDNFIKQLSETV